MIEIKDNFHKDTMSKEEYDRLNDIESWLYNHKIAETAIENLKDELKVLDTLKAVDTEANGKSSKISKSVENVQQQKELLESKINIMQMKLNKIDKALEALREDEKHVIIAYYMKNKRHKEISDELKISCAYCKKIKRIALNKIIFAVYGI